MLKFLASAALVACASAAGVLPYDLVTLLQLNPEESTLVTAVVAANLAGALSGKGPFTIFAPTNRAFNELPNGVLPALLKNVTLLTEVLTYHVVAGNVSSSQLTDGEQVPTLFKDHSIEVQVRKDPAGDVFVNLDHIAEVIYANTFGTNGVYHTIDHVLIPRPAQRSAGLAALLQEAEESSLISSSVALPALNLVERLEVIPEYSTLVTAVVAGKLAAALSAKGPFTLFAPDDEAFRRLPPGVLQRLLANITELDEVLTYHVVAGNVSSSQLKDGEEVPTLNTKKILVNIFNDPRPAPHTVVVLNKRVLVTLPDNFVTNGVFHGVDQVLLPPAIAKKYNA